MKQFCVLLSIVTLLACNPAGTPAQHPLADLADRLPVKLVCPDTNGSEARKAVGELIEAPEATWDKYAEVFKDDPIHVACLVLDGEKFVVQTLADLREKGEQASELYHQYEQALATIKEARKALGR